MMETEQIKRKSKSEKRQESYLKLKAQRKEKKKLNKQKKKLLQATENENVVDKIDSNKSISRKVIAKIGVKMTESACKVRVAVDCSLDDLMSIKDVSKLQNQLTNCYGLNRRSMTPLQFFVSSFNGQLEQRFTSTGNPVGEFRSWDVNFRSEHFQELFDKKDIIYLCAESDTVLEEFSDTKVYIIGGLVDHNHHKGLCFRRAQESGFQTARLPISEHLTLNCRAVLSVVHVFDIILKRCEGLSWNDSLTQSIPQRKIAELNDDKVDKTKTLVGIEMPEQVTEILQ